MITNLAYKALIKEVELTPKPGLVDTANNGSHSDMNLQSFYDSATAIKPFINRFVDCGDYFIGLRQIGLECEKAMFLATNGVNTHKGMIFSFAVICGALGSLKTHNLLSLHVKIKEICKDLVNNDLKNVKKVKTHGEKFYKETKRAGIREEAQNGYPLIFLKALPFYKKQLECYNEDMALKLTLLMLISINDDSNLYARGSLEGLKFAQDESKKLLHVKIENLDEKLQEFDTIMIEKNLSPGGSADLLGITWFIQKIEEQIWK